jgi:hypothetical protein
LKEHVVYRTGNLIFGEFFEGIKKISIKSSSELDWWIHWGLMLSLGECGRSEEMTNALWASTEQIQLLLSTLG